MGWTRTRTTSSSCIGLIAYSESNSAVHRLGNRASSAINRSPLFLLHRLMILNKLVDLIDLRNLSGKIMAIDPLRKLGSLAAKSKSNSLRGRLALAANTLLEFQAPPGSSGLGFGPIFSRLFPMPLV